MIIVGVIENSPYGHNEMILERRPKRKWRKHHSFLSLLTWVTRSRTQNTQDLIVKSKGRSKNKAVSWCRIQQSFSIIDLVISQNGYSLILDRTLNKCSKRKIIKKEREYSETQNTSFKGDSVWIYATFIYNLFNNEATKQYGCAIGDHKMTPILYTDSFGSILQKTHLQNSNKQNQLFNAIQKTNCI